MARVVLWTGPVSSAQIAGATVSDASKNVLIQCMGDVHPTCAERANGLLVDAGDEAFVGAFSAGGSYAKRVLLHPEAREQTRALMLADATFTDWAAPGSPSPPEGFVLYALDALTGPHLFVATASSFPNKNLPNGSQTLEALRKEIEHRSGSSFEEVKIDGVSPAPLRAWKLRNILFADYGTIVTHPEHATKLAAQYWQNVLSPWLAGVSGPPGGSSFPLVEKKKPSFWLAAAAVAGGAAAGYLGVRWLRRRHK